MVFQFQLTKKQDVVPTTRDYVGEREAQLRKRESQRGALWRVAS
jgi:cyclopropane-fatty-acyl-phospholipid synthase